MSALGDSVKKVRNIEILDWTSLFQYTLFLCQGDEKKMKICLVDEEKDEIRINSKEEFDSNVQCARDQGFTTLTFIIYKNNQLLFEGFYQIEKINSKFPSDKLKILEEKVLPEKWYIPVRQDEVLALCLKCSVQLAKEKSTNPENERFIEIILPDVFQKLLNSNSVYTWPPEIQLGIFEIVELFIDLVAFRIRSSPVPVTLLKILGLVFNQTTTFAKRHKHKPLPNQRILSLNDQNFIENSIGNENFRWIKFFLLHFVEAKGLENLQEQFEKIDATDVVRAAKEFDVLLNVFLRCWSCINVESFQANFSRSIDRISKFIEKEKFSVELGQLEQTLNEVFRLIERKNSDEPEFSTRRKSKNIDETETISSQFLNLKMNNSDDERKNNKKQRTEEQPTGALSNQNNLIDYIGEILKNNEKRSSKRKHRRTTISSSEVRTKEINLTVPNFDRSNSEEILRFYGPMKMKVEQLYDELRINFARGNIREVLKIEEKLKLIQPYSGRFIGDENTADGTVMKPGQRFEKSWILFNDGSLPWSDENVELMNLTDGIQFVKKPFIPVAAPHSKTILSVEFVAPDRPGFYESKWILTHREKTFGPIIWCSIEVRTDVENESFSLPTAKFTDTIELNSSFVQLEIPDCFDLSKPFRARRSTSFRDSIESDFSEFSFNSSEKFQKQNSTSAVSSTTMDEQKPLIDFATEEEKTKISTSTDFVESLVNNLCNVTNQARNTAKAIFNSLQAIDEVEPKVLTNKNDEEQKNNSQLVNSYFFVPRPRSMDPMERLVEMGFANRQKNQRLMKENNNDFEKVLEILTSENVEDSNWFNHRH